ncbi:MAG: hypothetical protein OXC08_16440 [Thiotrichales bacterium]|nr:hypothetical protein [Thiotrichales bacterium]
MPWGKAQSVAILLKAKRGGDTTLAAKARSSLRGLGKRKKRTGRKKR